MVHNRAMPGDDYRDAAGVNGAAFCICISPFTRKLSALEQTGDAQEILKEQARMSLIGWCVTGPFLGYSGGRARVLERLGYFPDADGIVQPDMSNLRVHLDVELQPVSARAIAKSLIWRDFVAGQAGRARRQIKHVQMPVKGELVSG